MGWGPRHKPIGYKFAHEIAPGDVLLIARRHKFNAEIVGFGVVRGRYLRKVKGVKTPESFGSARRLSPFVPISEAPASIHLIEALRHTSALARLHPARADRWYRAHALVCNWMERLLSVNDAPRPASRESSKAEKEEHLDAKELRIVAHPRNHQLDYVFRSRKQVIRAVKAEALLLLRYRQWLKRRGRKLVTAKIGKLQCDGFEAKPRNLIEAKSSISREHLRMAVGQLLDYAYHLEDKFGKPNMAILLPREPDRPSLGWLHQANISLIWHHAGAFLDDANGQFT